MRKKFDAEHIRSLCSNSDNPDVVPCMEAQVALNELCRYFLGDNWYDASGRTSPEQVNLTIVCEIEKQYKGAKLKRKVIYV